MYDPAKMYAGWWIDKGSSTTRHAETWQRSVVLKPIQREACIFQSTDQPIGGTSAGIPQFLASTLQ